MAVRSLRSSDKMIGHAACRVLADGVNLNHARHLDLAMPRNCVARPSWSREFLEGLMRHAILLTDANRLQPAAANITAHGPDVKPEAFRDLFERIQAVVIYQTAYTSLNISICQ
jgi:hypothetical protein